jgi:hypothetical protein
MAYVKWGVIAAVLAAFVGLLHWSLPQRDVVQIVGTDVKREDVTSADGEITSRDVRFINARTEDGRPRVYRNEDTGWGFPFYFKFDTGDLTAEAQSLAKTDQWVAVTHYGWRIPLFSMFPNAVSLREVSSPAVSFFPWFNVIFLSVLALALFAVYRRIQRFRRRRIDPMLEEIDESWDEMGDRASGLWQRIRRFFAGR